MLGPQAGISTFFRCLAEAESERETGTTHFVLLRDLTGPWANFSWSPWAQASRVFLGGFFSFFFGPILVSNLAFPYIAIHMVTWVYNTYLGVKDDYLIIHEGYGYELVRRTYAKENPRTIIGLTQEHDASI